MNKKWRKPGQYKRLLAVLFAAILILQAVPMQSAVYVTASAAEAVEGETQDNQDNSDKTDNGSEEIQGSSDQDSSQDSGGQSDKQEDEKDEQESSPSESSSDAVSEDEPAADSKDDQNDQSDTADQVAEEEKQDTQDKSDETQDKPEETQDKSGEKEDKSDETNTGSTEDRDSSGQRNSGQDTSSEKSDEAAGKDDADTGTKDNSKAGSDSAAEKNKKDSKGDGGKDSSGTVTSDEKDRDKESVKTQKEKAGEGTPGTEETKEPTVKFEGYKVEGDESFSNEDKTEAFVDSKDTEKAVTLKYTFDGEDGTYLEFRQVEDPETSDEDKKYSKLEKTDDEYIVKFDGTDEVYKYVQVRAVYEKYAEETLKSTAHTFLVVIDKEAPSIEDVKLSPTDVSFNYNTAVKRALTITATLKDSLLDKIGSSKYSLKYVDVAEEKTKEELADLNGWANIPDDGIRIVNGKGYVYLMAVDAVGHTIYSTATEGGYFIDSTKPKVTLSATPDAENKKIEVSISAEDNESNGVASGLVDKFSYVLKLGEDTKKEGTGDLTIGEDGKGTGKVVLEDLEIDAEYGLTVSVTDNAENEGYEVKTLKVDFESPKLSVVPAFDPENPGDQIETKESVTYTVTASDNNGIFTVYSRAVEKGETAPSFAVSDTDGWTTEGSDASITVTYDEDSNKDVYFAALDEAGNASDVIRAKSFFIDKTPPTITVDDDQIEAAGSGATNHTMQVKFADPEVNGVCSGLKSFSYSFTDSNGNEIESLSGKDKEISASEDGSYTWTFTDESCEDTLHGTYTLSVTAEDKFGNVSETKTCTFKYDNEGPEITIKSSITTTVDSEGNLCLNDDMEFTVTVTDPDAAANSTPELTYAACIYKKGAAEADYKWINGSTGTGYIDYTDQVILTKKELDDSGIEFEDLQTYTIKVFAKDSLGNNEKSSPEISFVYYQKDKATGEINAGAGDGAKSSLSADKKTVYYNKAVTVTYTANHGGAYTTVYGKNGSDVTADQTLDEPYSVELTDSASTEPEHPVYDNFGISGKDYAGNNIAVSEKPDKKIVIDTKAPVITGWKPETDKPFSIVKTYTITAADSGCGVDNVSYVVIDSGKSIDEVTMGWKKAAKGEDGYSIQLRNNKGDLYVRATDKLGNVSEPSKVTSVVTEDEKPEIKLDVKDNNDKTADLNSYYGNTALHVNVTVTEKPDDGDEVGYSGINMVNWALYKEGNKTAVGSGILLGSQNPPETIADLKTDSYKTYSGVIDKDTLAGFVTETGTYNLKVWATDFCGNGAADGDAAVVTIKYDTAGPTVTVQMENGVIKDDSFYYREDNADITVTLSEDTGADNINSAEVIIKPVSPSAGSPSEGKELRKDSLTDQNGQKVIEIKAGDLTDLFGADSEEEFEIKVSAKDEHGNITNVITESGTTGVSLVKTTDGAIEAAKFIRDTVAPAITITYTPASTTYVYNGDSTKLCAHTTGNVTAVCEVDDTYIDDSKLYYKTVKKEGSTETEDVTTWDKGTPGSVNLLSKDGSEILYTISAYGTDIAGNPAVVKDIMFDNGSALIETPTGITLPTVSDAGKIGCNTEYTPTYSFMMDKKAPEITLSYDTKADVYVYEESTEQITNEGNTLDAYVSDTVQVSASVEETNIDLNRLWYVNPNDPAANWTQAADMGLKDAASDGIYLYSVYGTDRAGNAAIVKDKFADTAPVKKDFLSDKTISLYQEVEAGVSYTPYYAIIIDKTAPKIELAYTVDTTADSNAKAYVYDDKMHASNDLSAYVSGKVTAKTSVEETYIDFNRLWYENPNEPAVTWKQENFDLNDAATDGTYLYSVYGTDKAGNAAVVTEKFTDESALDTNYLGSAKALSRENKEAEKDYTPYYAIIIDSTVPLIELAYTVDTTADPEAKAYVYDDKMHAANDLSAYVSGKVTAKTSVDDTNIDLNRLWYVNPNDSAANWIQAPDMTLADADTDGTYLYSVYGTDRAGNAAYVTEKFTDESALDIQYLGSAAALSRPNVKAETNYTPYYAIIIDSTVPLIELAYTVDTTANPNAKAYVYGDKTDAGNVLSAYVNGKVTAKASVDDTNIDLNRLWYVNPNDSAAKWTQATDLGLKDTASDGIYLYSVYGTDRAGNAAAVTEKFTEESALDTNYLGSAKALSRSDEKAKEDYTPYYAIIIDTTSPAVTKIVTNDQKLDENNKVVAGAESKPPYYEDDHTFYYNAAEGMQTVYEIEETNYDRKRVSSTYEVDGEETKFDSQETDNTYTITFTKDGSYTAVTLIGTDRAGNHVVIKDASDADNEAKAANPSQNAAAVNTVADQDNYDGLKDTTVVLSYNRILDRVSPVAVITHIIPKDTTGYLYPEKENGSTATMYSRNVVRTNIKVSDTYGKGDQAKAVLLDGEKLNFRKHYRKAGGSFTASAAEQWPKLPDSKDPFSQDVDTDKEGHYTFSISGTDRAGNKVIVNESLNTDKENAEVNKKKGNYDGAKPEKDAESPYKSFYALVYDCTSPTYRFTINNPSNLDETFDENKMVAYYGKSIKTIKAKFVVEDNNFDDTRVLADITSKSASGVNNMDALYPEWTTPKTKGSTSEKNGLTTATFNLTVDVDSQHEGMHRFEIEGCDKAGNYLVKSSDQKKVDESSARADKAASTLAKDAKTGKYWTYRKAVDVTAPKGVLKVRKSKGDETNYYELKLEPSGNISVHYEDPFRQETSAYVIVESTDQSPTYIKYDLRSQDKSKDSSYRANNPLVSGGTNGYYNDNTRDVTVNGEQAFYLENVLIKDRAGNVCSSDPKSQYALPRSNNVYLDVTSPVVSKIEDAESPQVKIVASGSFTRHEADGERYIYKPDGNALDLKVTVTDPGGEERSSGLKSVTVEVKVGDNVVTNRVNLSNIPYTYEKGPSDSHNPLKYEIPDGHISIPVGSFAESNDICIKVEAEDNSENKTVATKDGGLLYLGIDTTAPKVEVNYHDTVKPEHDKYFRADRVVEIVVIDRNVDNDKININTNTGVPGSFNAPHDNKSSDGSGETGNDDRWTKTLTYDQDLDYTLQISGTDALGNSISDIKWNGLAPNEFTVDKTPPRIRINLPTPVQTVDDIKYYDNAATATVEIEEHNFFEETDTNLLDVTIEPDNHSGADKPENPGRSSFSNSGTDMHISTVDCKKDGDYEITAKYTDMAGNPAVVDGGEGKKSDQKAWSTKFTIDTVDPVLQMDPNTFNVDSATGKPVEGLENQIYTQENFAPRVLIKDINYDAANSDFEVVTYGVNSKDQITDKDGDEKKGEYNIQFRNFEMVRDLDGVYKVTAVATDKAKHQATLDFMFSVNRFGSTYVYADDLTESKVDRYYINNTEDPLRILELTPVELKTHQVELFKDHNRSILSDDTQYTFDTAKGSTKVGTSAEGHRVYEYKIAPEVYEEEGVYDFILSSTDAAGNENSTALFHDGTVNDHEIDSVKFPIEFQVDKTVPVNRLTGAETEKEQFNTNELELTVYPEDYQTDIKDVEVKIWDGSKNGSNATEDKEKYMHYRYISEEEDAEALAQEHVYPIEDAKQGIPVTLEDKGDWQLLEVITTDLAGNVSTDYRTGDNSVNLPDTRRRFLVTTNPLIQFYNFKPAFYGTLGGAAILLLLFFLWKRKKDEEKNAAAG